MPKADWQEIRRKGWHLLLLLASAYAAYDPRLAWAVPVLTGAAGLSDPPRALARPQAAGAVVLAVVAGLAARWLDS